MHVCPSSARANPGEQLQSRDSPVLVQQNWLHPPLSTRHGPDVTDRSNASRDGKKRNNFDIMIPSSNYLEVFIICCNIRNLSRQDLKYFETVLPKETNRLSYSSDAPPVFRTGAHCSQTIRITDLNGTEVDRTTCNTTVLQFWLLSHSVAPLGRNTSCFPLRNFSRNQSRFRRTLVRDNKTSSTELASVLWIDKWRNFISPKDQKCQGRRCEMETVGKVDWERSEWQVLRIV